MAQLGKTRAPQKLLQFVRHVFAPVHPYNPAIACRQCPQKIVDRVHRSKPSDDSQSFYNVPRIRCGQIEPPTCFQHPVNFNQNRHWIEIQVFKHLAHYNTIEGTALIWQPVRTQIYRLPRDSVAGITFLDPRVFDVFGDVLSHDFKTSFSHSDTGYTEIRAISRTLPAIGPGLKQPTCRSITSCSVRQYVCSSVRI